MLFYHYSVAYLKNGEPIKFRSLDPLFPSLEKLDYASYQCYAGHVEVPPPFYVMSLGHERAYPGKINLPRSTNAFFIHYVTKGVGYVNGNTVRAGQIFYLLPNQVHELLADSNDPWEFFYMSVSGTSVQAIMDSSGILTMDPIADYQIHEKQIAIFRELLYQAHDDEDLELYFISGFMRLISYHKKLVSPVFSQKKGASYLYYQEALTFISEQFYANLSASDVADYLHISPSYLRAIFSTHCKYSLRELLLRKHIDYAAKHLVTNHASVMLAAALAGYNNQMTFSRIFKKYTGMSPSDYRKCRRSLSLIEENITKFNPKS